MCMLCDLSAEPELTCHGNLLVLLTTAIYLHRAKLTVQERTNTILEYSEHMQLCSIFSICDDGKG